VKLTKQQRDAAASRLEKLGDIEELKGRSDLALLRLHGQSDDPRKMWQQARQALGDAASVQPVLLDPNGAPQFPTGEVTVRFQSKLTDEELRRFAASAAERVRGRAGRVRSSRTDPLSTGRRRRAQHQHCDAARLGEHGSRVRAALEAAPLRTPS
jgi:hypothetical protein